MILLMGIAGSGKGTQGQMLAEQHGYKVIGMGDVVRAEASDEQRQRMLAGGLLADGEVITMMDAVLDGLDDLSHVILDGFPRTVAQAEWLLQQVTAGRFTLDAAFHLVASREAVKARLLNRARADDVDDSIEKRFNEYEKLTAPILQWLADNNITVINVDAEREVAVINSDIISNLEQ